MRRLLDKIGFDPATDRLWSVGDLVGRGRQSLETLRYLHSLGDALITVLGNHDLNLLAVAQGLRKVRGKDRLGPLLAADERDELLHWLRHRPVLHHDAGLGYTMVHAGLPPQWDLAQARARAAELEHALRGEDYALLLDLMYGDEPAHWSDALEGWERLRVIVNAFTRLRYCDRDGRMDFNHKGARGSQPPELVPWFEAPGRKSIDMKIVFGHWSTLGFVQSHRVTALDTGCVWGGRLTAVRLDNATPAPVSIDCPGAQRPGA